MELQDKNVLVLGLGESGMAMARWAAREGANVRVADSRDAPARLDALRTALPDVPVLCGAFAISLLEGIDLIAISPGLAPQLPPQNALLMEARAKSIAIWGELEFFARKLVELEQTKGYTPKIVAVTGTNGKTTVTRLTGELCLRAGRSTRVAGNIGPAALDALREAMDENNLPEVWVLELSSFQLHGESSLKASVATILNISEDHLDWHGSMDAYAADKARIFSAATTRVLNRDDARVMACAEGSPRLITYGLGEPVDADSFGVIHDGVMRWLAYAEDSEVEPGGSTRRIKKPLRGPVIVKRLMPVEALRIRGDHNASNALAALALGRAIDLPLAPLLHGLREYHGEPHRVEYVLRVNDVDYVDDSKGTNVGATIAALNGLGQPVVLIAGGDGKGQDFSPLVDPIARHARAVMLIGKDGPKIRAVLEQSGLHDSIAIEDCLSLEQAVDVAASYAKPGDAVLLSPACASLDMFRDYRHRADVFLEAAMQRARLAGQPC